MESLVLEKMAAIVAAGRLDLASYFKQCAILGVTFAVAVAAVAGTEAFAKAEVEKPFAARQYSDFVSADVVDLFAAPVVVAQTPSTPTWSGQAPPFNQRPPWSGLQAPKF